MRYVLGVDQGGSKTHAAVADLGGRILGVGLAGGGYHALTGMDHAMAQVMSAARMAVERAGVSMEDIAAVGAGMTGADFDYEYPLLESALQQRFPGSMVRVKNDCMIALYAASESQDAAILCAGTGLNCGVRRASGDEFVFGYYIDDRWQGGVALGQQALQAVLDAEVGLSPRTPLTARMLAATGAPDVDALLKAKVHGELDTAKLKHFVREIDECALVGDAVAVGLLLDFGDACARYALAGMERLDMPREGVDVALSGSVFKCRSPVLMHRIAGRIRAEYPGARILDARYEPVVGGVRLALELIGAPCPLMTLETTAISMRLLRKPNSDD